MKFTPQQYSIADVAGVPFIDPSEIRSYLDCTPTEAQIDAVISESMNYKRLSLSQVAALLNAPIYLRERIFKAAEELKKAIYGNRIVLFAPLYVGNRCTNLCSYCTFKADNKLAIRKTLTSSELRDEVMALEDAGHKRLILVYGEHPAYDADYISESVKQVYGIKSGKSGEIRRVNINAAPLSEADFAKVAQSGIGTYQIFQETYDESIYKQYHLGGKKADYNWRLTAFDRAMVSGIDDIGLGALLGLGDWKFDIMGLIRHTNHLEACFGVGPHTISFPRITEALGADAIEKPINDADFVYAIAVLRLAVPYTGLILTAREPAKLRDEAIKYGVSQIDGGTQIEIGSYANNDEKSEEGSGQFTINDNRPLADIIKNLVNDGYMPSFCTACYRKGRTGEHFMTFSSSGYIKKFCAPNAILTFAEYLEDYCDQQTRDKGYQLIDSQLDNTSNRTEVVHRLNDIKSGHRDLYF